jgi:sortase B
MKKRTLSIGIGVVLLVAAAVCLWQVVKSTYAPKTVLSEQVAMATAEPESTQPPAAADTDTSETVETEEEEEDAVVVTETYVSDIDFDALRSINSDIYGWIEIDGTNISYPIVQSPDDDTYYLTHNTDGRYSANGSIYSEHAYNATDFSDPVTVLYGHHMSSGAMFGKLQQYYADATFFEDNPIITIYTPDATLEYGVFAAVPYGSEHLLYNNDFTDDNVFSYFFEAVMNIRSLNAQFREEYAPQSGDKVLILSTCLAGDNTRRFLVMATLLS